MLYHCFWLSIFGRLSNALGHVLNPDHLIRQRACGLIIENGPFEEKKKTLGVQGTVYPLTKSDTDEMKTGLPNLI